MIVVTTEGVPNYTISETLGVVTGEVVYGSNVFRDFFASIRDVVGGRTKSYERLFSNGAIQATEDAMERAAQAGADGIIGLRISYISIGGDRDKLFAVTAVGTAVKLVKT